MKVCTVMSYSAINSNGAISIFIVPAIVLALLLLLLAAISLSYPIQAHTSNTSKSSISYHGNTSSSNRELQVFSADSKPYNLTYGEWTAKWWQWAYSISKNMNPAYDDSGKYCAQKQNTQVWFLAGTYGHNVYRVCDIPAGRAILLPILNSECSFAEFPKLRTLSELRICAKTIQDQVNTLTASVDGVPISDLEKYRVQSPPFNFSLPPDNILGLTGNVTTLAVADGNWVFLKPLSPGNHKIIFKGGVEQQQQTKSEANYNNLSSSFAFPTGWDFETVYDITVKNATYTQYHSYFSNANDKKNSNINKTTLYSSIISQEQERTAAAAIKNFQNTFCGDNIMTTTNSNSNFNGYITEYTLPQSCEMPLGIAVDSDAHRVWYVSTKRGVLGSYDMEEDKFDQEHIIPVWNSREDPVGFSQAWSVKIDNGKKQGDIWFTDTQQNAIWRYIKQSQIFEMYKIPGKSSSFGTTYPISLEIDSKSNRIFFAGTYSHSLWIGDISKMRNGTSEGISQVLIPIDNNTFFNGIDSLYITTGSLAIDNKRNSVWISVFSYGNKGEIFRYDLERQSFDKRFDLPPELSSPVGMVVDNDDNSGHLWITNAGSSIFYELNPNNGKVTKFVTSKASPRIFGQGLFGDVSQQKKIHGNSSNKNISKNAYTLPYWIQKASDGSLWFNEQEGNKIGRFDPSNMKLIEYWIPSQNRLWGSCSSDSHSDSSGSDSNNNNTSKNTSNSEDEINTNNQTCGIANVLQFSVTPQMADNDDDGHNKRHSKPAHSLQRQQHVWFTEWSENKIAKVDSSDELLPFSVVLSSIPHNKEIIIKRGENKEIKVKVIPEESAISTISDNMNIHMLASATFTSTGDLGNSTGTFSEESFSVNMANRYSKHDVLFVLTPSTDLKPGLYTLMIGAENDAVSYLNAIKVRIL
jgi:virginiamycin B lyase